MIRSMTATLTALLLSQAVSAQGSAVYRDEVITIPSGTVITSDGVAHFRDIRLIEQEDGSFRVAAAERGEIAEVDSVEVNPLAGDEVEVTVKGAKSSACVELLEPTVSFKDDTFTVVLAESKPTSEVCILILEYYEERFTLDVSELEPGSYTVDVNGVEEEFTLQ